MQQNGRYQSPLGEILLAADELGMIGLWFEGQRYFGLGLQKDSETRETPVLETARRWLDVYFSGQDPSFSVPLHVQGTEFQQRVWRALLTIPYGATSTYGQIARQMAAENGGGRVSARAVGHAVGRVCPFAVNPGVAVYLDVSLRRFETVFPACGSANSAIELTIPELEQYSGCKQWVDVCKAWQG